MKSIILFLVAGISLLPGLACAQFAYWAPSLGGNGHYYEAVVVSNGITWSNASANATNKGGYLAAITSSEENNFVFGLIKTNLALWNHRFTGNSWGPWIGGLQLPGSIEPAGGWVWVTGEPFVYAHWNTGEPSNDNGVEDHIHFWAEQAQVGDVWNDKVGTDTGVKGYVIEYDTHPNAARVRIARQGARDVQLSWPSRNSVSYTVQWTALLPVKDWTTLTNLAGTGGLCSVVDTGSSGPKFYRVLSTP